MLKSTLKITNQAETCPASNFLNKYLCFRLKLLCERTICLNPYWSINRKYLAFYFWLVYLLTRTDSQLQEIVYEYGKIPARNPGSFDHDHFIAISSSLWTLPQGVRIIYCREEWLKSRLWYCFRLMIPNKESVDLENQAAEKMTYNRPMGIGVTEFNLAIHLNICSAYAPPSLYLLKQWSF